MKNMPAWKRLMNTPAMIARFGILRRVVTGTSAQLTALDRALGLSADDMEVSSIGARDSGPARLPSGQFASHAWLRTAESLSSQDRAFLCSAVAS